MNAEVAFFPTRTLPPGLNAVAGLRCYAAGALCVAQDEKSGARVAVRSVPVKANGLAGVAALEKFPRHPALPRFLNFTFDDDDARFVVSLGAGEGMPGAVPEQLTFRGVVQAGAQLFGALAVLHAEGVAHGELSLESLHFGGDGQLVVWDAPIVLVDRRIERRGEGRWLLKLERCAPYLPPERARGAAASSPSDVYSAAAVLCRIAGGVGPEGSALEQVRAIARGNFRPIASVQAPQPLIALLERLCAKDPAERPSAEEAARALSQMGEGGDWDAPVRRPAPAVVPEPEAKPELQKEPLARRVARAIETFVHAGGAWRYAAVGATAALPLVLLMTLVAYLAVPSASLPPPLPRPKSAPVASPIQAAPAPVAVAASEPADMAPLAPAPAATADALMHVEPLNPVAQEIDARKQRFKTVAVTQDRTEGFTTTVKPDLSLMKPPADVRSKKERQRRP